MKDSNQCKKILKYIYLIWHSCPKTDWKIEMYYSILIRYNTRSHQGRKINDVSEGTVFVGMYIGHIYNVKQIGKWIKWKKGPTPIILSLTLSKSLHNCLLKFLYTKVKDTLLRSSSCRRSIPSICKLNFFCLDTLTQRFVNPVKSSGDRHILLKWTRSKNCREYETKIETIKFIHHNFSTP